MAWSHRRLQRRASNVDIADRLTGKLLLIHGEMDDQVHPDHTRRLADRLIAADEVLVVPGAEHTFVDCLAYVRKRCWHFLVSELMRKQPPAYQPAPIPIDPELLGVLFAGARPRPRFSRRAEQRSDDDDLRMTEGLVGGD